jgi:8-oxo-dGTP pyrophosphatase MutT (NUDIX family)
MSSRFQRTGSETLYEGPMFAVRRDKYRHEDGEEVTREIVSHPGAVGVVVLDGDRLWLVRQPREAVDSPDMLEIPAGKLDEDGEDARETAERELAEEIGKRAAHWESLGAYHSSVGFTDEVVHLYLATGISDVDSRPEVEEQERIDVEVRPVADLDAILAETTDAKTLIALLKLRERLTGAGGARH